MSDGGTSAPLCRIRTKTTGASALSRHSAFRAVRAGAGPRSRIVLAAREPSVEPCVLFRRLLCRAECEARDILHASVRASLPFPPPCRGSHLKATRS